MSEDNTEVIEPPKKKKKGGNPGGNPKALEKARAARKRNSGKDMFIFQRDPENKEELSAPQAQVILSVIKEAGKDGITREELVKVLSDPEVLPTRQPPERVLAFYQSNMVKNGLVQHLPAAKNSSGESDQD